MIIFDHVDEKGKLRHNAIMTEQRKTVRVPVYASVNVEGLEDEKSLLKDISITGCRVLCPTTTKIELRTKYRLEITPEADAKIDLFDLFAEAKWIRACANSFEIGFFILESPKGEQFQHYVDYLSYRYANGNSISGGNYVKILELG